ncbi:MAG: VWA domain-containing protein [Planctomycetes bacterium]|nr:VWA domain-containing protein [Planctomycetota bacterium]
MTKTTHPALSLALPTLLLAAAIPAQEAQSNFGHARTRKLADIGRLPTSRDVVVRDIVNYHRHRVPLPRAGQAVALEVRSDRVGAAPGEEFWLQVGYATRADGDRALAPPTSVALVVDCSGSMSERDKMSQVHRGLQAFAERMRADDEIALVAFSAEARVVHPLRTRGEGTWLGDAIAQLRPEGNTNLEAGLRRGLELLGDARHTSRRVVLLTDGIANTGVTDPDEILQRVSSLTAAGVDVSTIGVGESLDTALLQRLAAGTRGLCHFVPDAKEIDKVFVAEAESLLSPAARQVELELQMPVTCSYRVIGHEHTVTHGMFVKIPLPDLNAGATGVVMLRCRMDDDVAGSDPTGVSATLRYRDAIRNRPKQVTAGTSLAVHDHRDQHRADLTVLKNAAIALLTEGLHEMALCCDARRWADADRALWRARDAANELFPGEDVDVQRVRDLAAAHQQTLRRYLDRFRDV